jgi:hypothetical protein
LKISFHKSGIFRVALNAGSPRPALSRWHRGSEIAPSCVRVFSIVVPPILTKYPMNDRLPDSKSVICVPAPSSNEKVIFGIYITRRDLPENYILNLPRDRPLTIHGSVRLKTQRGWLTSYYGEFRKEVELPVIKQHLDKVRVPANIFGDAPSGYMHMYQKKNGSCHVADVQLGWENVFTVGESYRKWVMIQEGLTGGT